MDIESEFAFNVVSMDFMVAPLCAFYQKLNGLSLFS